MIRLANLPPRYASQVDLDCSDRSIVRVIPAFLLWVSALLPLGDGEISPSRQTGCDDIGMRLVGGGEVKSVDQMFCALVVRGVEKAKRDPVGFTVLVGGSLLPRVRPVIVGEVLYWAAWWILLSCWFFGTADRPLWTLDDAGCLKRMIEGRLWGRAILEHLARRKADRGRIRSARAWRHSAGLWMSR